jgi:hypothetical protein
MYLRLEESAPEAAVFVRSDTRRALAGALACVEVAGSILFQASVMDLQMVAEGPGRYEQAISAKTMMRMARRLTIEAANNVEKLSLSSEQPHVGRRVAADIAALQMIGVLVARELYQHQIFLQL